MIEVFRNLPTKQKWIVGIIALLIFPITLTLLIADFAINGYKEGKIIKLITGVFALLIVIGLFWQGSPSSSSSLFDDKVKELNETKNRLNKVQAELNTKEEIINQSKIYLDLNENEKNEVDKFIENVKNKEKTGKQDESKGGTAEIIDTKENKPGSVEIKDTEENKPGSVEIIDSEKANNNSNTNSNNVGNSKVASNESSDFVEEQQETIQNSGSTVYANGGKSKSNKYHSSPTAHNMEGSIGMSESEAKANGYVPCGKCY